MLVKWNSRPYLSTWLDRVIDSELSTAVGRDHTSTIPLVNIKEDENGFALEVAAPGLDKGDFKLDVKEGVLYVSAEKKTENEDKKDNYRRKEFSYTSFKRAFTLPRSVDGEKIEANYNHGVLNIAIPKKAEAKPREITIS